METPLAGGSPMKRPMPGSWTHFWQEAGIDDMMCGVAVLVSGLSETMTLAPGDIIVTGTPSGVGMARRPPLWMRAGDVCEIEIEGVGVLRNPIADEMQARAAAE